MTDSLILLNPEPLTEAFIPEQLLHREGQLKEILTHIKPALHKKQGRNVLVTGNTGTGKTSLVRWLLREHAEKNHAYVNCLNCRSEHKILEHILIQLGQVIPENKPTDYLAQAFSKKITRGIVVCLDEVDQVKNERILQTLVDQVTLVLISNRPLFIDAIDDRIRTRLFLAEVEFPRFRRTELVDIMKDRIEFALKPDSISERMLELVATWSNGDARVALQTLRAAATCADSKKRSEISIDDLREAFKGARRSKLEYVRSKLNEHQRFLLNIIEKRQLIESGELFRLYEDSFPQPLGERAYRNQMEHLVHAGLVKESGEGRWKKFEVSNARYA